VREGFIDFLYNILYSNRLKTGIMKAISMMTLMVLFTVCGTGLFAQTEDQAVVSADQLNVLYAGIDNPVSIAVPGITNDKIRVSISNGTITGSNGKYVVNVKTGEETIIVVSAELKPGELSRAGSFIFRIAPIPDPVIIIGNKDSRDYYFTKDELLKGGELNVLMNIPLKINYEILSYVFVSEVDGEIMTRKINGNKFTKEIVEAINAIEPGKRFWIEQITAKVPDGTRILTGICVHIVNKK
jgi:hypothetical protein